MDKATVLRAYARMMNTLREDHMKELLDMLPEDFTWESQKVFSALEGKKAYAEYICPKLRAFVKSDVRAEMGQIYAYGEEQPCVILTQTIDGEIISALVFAKIDNGEVRRMDICMIPPASQARGTGEFPE